MHEGPQAALRVALLAEEGVRGEFRDLLENAGIAVVLDGKLGMPLPDVWNGAEVLLVAMDERPDRHRVRGLLEQSPVPVLLNRGGIGATAIWHRRLVDKLQILAKRAVPNASISGQHNRPELRVVQDKSAFPTDRPWTVVLGASIGGPKAVARFLQALPDDLPVTFLLAQHISESFQDLLVEQLDRCSVWPVAMLGEGQTVDAGQVWMVPAGSRIDMNVDGAICRSGRDWGSTYRPDINEVLHCAAEAFGARCGAIMFSGLGKDGALGCESISKQGGFVWAQSAESCVISHMPEAARRSCKVELSGTPEELALALRSRCQSEPLRIN